MRFRFLDLGVAVFTFGCHPAPNLDVAPSRQTISTVPAVIHVPFYLFGSRMYVEGEVNGQQGLLLLDTGSGTLVLNDNRTTVPALGVINTGGGAGVQSTGLPITVYQVNRLHWGGGDMRGFTAYGVDLQEDERALREVPVFDSLHKPLLGIIGLAQIEPYLSVFDYEARRLVLYALDASGAPRVGRRVLGAATPIPVTTDGGQVSLPTSVAGRSVPLVFDTGAEGADVYLTAETAHALSGHLVVGSSLAIQANDVGGTLRVNGKSGKLDRVVLGPVEFDTLFTLSGVTRSDLLGAAALRILARHKHKLGLNLRTKMVYVWSD